MKLLRAFERFPDEAALVGRTVAGYADLEVDLMNCVQVVRGNDLDAVFKAMFRPRGETNRIDIADGLGRFPFKRLKLDTEFSMGISAMRHCLKIRNNYAHGYWHDDNKGKLAFVPFEELAHEHTPVVNLSGLAFYYIDVPLLREQLSYFEYTLDLFNWVNFESRVRNGNMKANPFEKPKTRAQPNQHL